MFLEGLETSMNHENFAKKIEENFKKNGRKIREKTNNLSGEE